MFIKIVILIKITFSINNIYNNDDNDFHFLGISMYRRNKGCDCDNDDTSCYNNNDYATTLTYDDSNYNDY